MPVSRIAHSEPSANLTARVEPIPFPVPATGVELATEEGMNLVMSRSRIIVQTSCRGASKMQDSHTRGFVTTNNDGEGRLINCANRIAPIEGGWTRKGFPPDYFTSKERKKERKKKTVRKTRGICGISHQLGGLVPNPYSVYFSSTVKG